MSETQCCCWSFDHPPCPIHPNATEEFKAALNPSATSEDDMATIPCAISGGKVEWVKAIAAALAEREREVIERCLQAARDSLMDEAPATRDDQMVNWGVRRACKAIRTLQGLG